MISALLNILLLLTILTVVVFLHELGHFLAAKWAGVTVQEFAVGMGPLVYSKKIGETQYSLRALLIGGYVKLLGEGDEEGDFDPTILDDKGNFQNQSALKKTVVLLAGVFMNLMTAVIIYTGFMVASGFVFTLPSEFVKYEPVFGDKEIVAATDIRYEGLVEGGNAEVAGWPDEGVIRAASISGTELTSFEFDFELRDFIQANPGEVIYVEICTDGNSNGCKIYETEVGDDGFVGFQLYANSYAEVTYRGINKVLVGFVHSVNIMDLAIEQISGTFAEARVTGDYQDAVNTVSSPIGLYYVVDFIRQIGVVGLLDLTANISLSLFLMNLLPIPALDGGRIGLVWMEKLLGNRFNKNIESWAIRISFLLLLIFMFAMFAKDIYYFDEIGEMFR